MAASRTGAAAGPESGATVKDGRPARVQAMPVLVKSHRFLCPRSELQLTYMIDIAVTMEFAIHAGSTRP
jgi:hypothetical protein